MKNWRPGARVEAWAAEIVEVERARARQEIPASMEREGEDPPAGPSQVPITFEDVLAKICDAQGMNLAHKLLRSYEDTHTCMDEEKQAQKEAATFIEGHNKRMVDLEASSVALNGLVDERKKQADEFKVGDKAATKAMKKANTPSRSCGQSLLRQRQRLKYLGLLSRRLKQLPRHLRQLQ
ncbi:hypothetical protein NE237_010300 [Protea cynaroides]|uniref:Uncharacterized protein n=1 Tax=Protea cynaroides TaxID=273540 RepID=A0A9Q0KZI9_9MAGN|nr:hypothetical protein NE237_010300 [Protea cynaroides]